MLSNFKSLSISLVQSRRRQGANLLPVDDSIGMEILQGEKNLRRIKLRLPKRKLLPLDMQHKIPSTDVLHYEIHSGLSLEA
jgi:hypothetical protein